jgi:hypothetical protein
MNDRRARRADGYRKEGTMSDDERSKKRKEHEDDEADVAAHMYESDDPGDLDPEKKRKRKQHDEPGSDDLERKKK